MSPRIGSMFSGYGGLDLGIAEVTGGTTAWVADVCGTPDTKNWPHKTPCKSPCTILAHRFPDAPNLGDVATIDWSTVEPVEILCAGFPCQDVSTAGKRAGLRDGTRTGLWSEVIRAIVALQPRLVVLENVPGIFTAPAAGDVEPCTWCVGDGPGEHLRALDAVLADLAEIGFDAEWVVVPASGVGGAHQRLRWFLAAHPQGQPWSFIHRDGGAAADASGLRRGERGSAGPGEAPGGRASANIAGRTDASLTLLGTPRASEWKGSGPVGSRSHAHMEEREYLSAQVLSLLPTLRVKNNENQQSEGYGGEDGNFFGLLHNPERWGDYAPAIARWETVLGRPAPEPTQTSSKGNPQLSPRFTEWLMGLPAGWITDVPGITRNEALKACGNGVVPQQAAEALRTLLTRMAVAA